MPKASPFRADEEQGHVRLAIAHARLVKDALITPFCLDAQGKLTAMIMARCG